MNCLVVADFSGLTYSDYARVCFALKLKKPNCLVVPPLALLDGDLYGQFKGKEFKYEKEFLYEPKKYKYYVVFIERESKEFVTVTYIDSKKRKSIILKVNLLELNNTSDKKNELKHTTSIKPKNQKNEKNK
jgi:hypothetical protein